MNLLPFLLDILKFSIAGMGVVYIAFYLAKPYLERGETIQLLEFKKSITTQTLTLRLQAYERLVLFIERINPANMLIRLDATSYPAHQLHSLILDEIRGEYQHNITQQLYVTTRTWGVIKHIREDTVSLANNIIKTLPETATGLEFSKIMLGHLSKLENDPYELGIGILRKDLEELF